MKKFVFFLIFFSALYGAKAQPYIQWQKSLGGTGSDGAYSVRQTSDTGYIVAGAAQSNDGDVTGHHGSSTNYDYWVTKLSQTGSLVWQKALGGTDDEIAYDVQQTSDGGYMVAGGAESVNNGDVTGFIGLEYDFWLTKLDASGNLSWESCYGGTSYNVARSMQQTTDNEYIVAGDSYSDDSEVTGHHGAWGAAADFWVLKVGVTGNMLWERSLGGSGMDQAKSVQQTADGGFIVAGSSTSVDGDVTGNHGSSDYWVVKLNDTGAIQWQKSLGGSVSDVAYSIRQTYDGGYIVVGGSNSNDSDVSGNHGGYDFWVVKLNAAGGITWQKSLGGTGDDWAYWVRQTPDSGYIITGSSSSNDGDVTGNHGSTDVWVVKINPVGAIMWQMSLGGPGEDNGYSVQQTLDTGYIVAGSSNSVTGDVTGNHGNSDFWVVKLRFSPALGTPALPRHGDFTIAPNPASGTVNVYGPAFSKIGIYDLLGRLKKEVYHSGSVSVSDLPAGMYFVRLYDDNGSTIYQDKIVKQ